MDKRKDFTISDKLQLIREILEGVEDHNKVQLEITNFSNHGKSLDKLCKKFNLHKMDNRREGYNWIWYHNGIDKQDITDANVLVTIFK